MSTLQIDVPEHLNVVMDGQIRSGRFPSPSEYVSRLIEEDERRRQ